MLFLKRFASEEKLKRRAVVDDDATVAVQDAAAGSDQRRGFYAVSLRAFVIDLRILNLQTPETGNEHKENTDGAVLKNGDFARREIGVVAQGRLVRELRLWFEVRIGRRKYHNEARKRLQLS
jgi:hypothetical protein